MTLGTLYLGNYGTVVYSGHAGFFGINSSVYLEGHGAMPGVVIWLTGAIRILSTSPRPESGG